VGVGDDAVTTTKAGLAQTIGSAIAILFLGLILLASALGIWAFGPGPKAPNGAAYQEVTLPRGTGVAAMGRILHKAKVINSEGAFRMAARFSGREGALRAGTYHFNSRMPVGAVVAQLVDGKVIQHFVTIPEGKTSAQVIRILKAAQGLTGEVEVPPEGAILPETYQYEIGETRQAVLERMLEAGRKTLDQLWAQRKPGLPLKSKEEALILASLVEKETGIASERPMVAAVFINRLNKGMRLESDPTVVYGVSRGEPLGRGILKSELERRTPWNTYIIDALPVTPIANPGKAALQAVLNPDQSDALFFVADGSGGHAFAASYSAHEENVAHWRELERQATP
jgi:UPF0755 protein